MRIENNLQFCALFQNSSVHLTNISHAIQCMYTCSSVSLWQKQWQENGTDMTVYVMHNYVN